MSKMNNWVTSKLPDIVTLTMGQSPSGADVNDSGNGIEFFQGKAEFGKLHPTARKYCTKPKKIANKNEILLSVRAPVGPTNLAHRDVCIGRGLASIRTDGINVYHMFMLHQFRAIEPWLSKQGTGSTFQSITGKFLKELDVALPPLAEQKVIAEKLDTLLAQVDSIKQHLERIPEILNKFRQSVLADAVSGKLTEEWRANNPNLSIRSLLGKYQQERVELKKQKKLKQKFGPVNNGVSGLYEPIPDDWEWVTFSHIAEHDNSALKAGPFGSSLKKSDCVDSGYRVYGQEQVIAGDEKLVTYYVDDNKFAQLISCKTKPQDILISLVGTIGKVLILSDDAEEGIINPRLVKLSLQSEIDKNFIKLFLNSPQTHRFFKGFSHGGTMEILNLTILKQLPIPMPSIEEQRLIAQKVEASYSVAANIERQALSALERVNKLTPSILAKAFRGELTEQWRLDNPDLISGENSAEALLEKINAEREPTKPKKRSKK